MSPDHPFGSMFGTYNHRRYGGNVGAPLPTGATGGHVMSIVPGTYDPKTGKVDVVDQYGYSHGKRNISDMDLRFAGAGAVAAAAARRGGQAPGAGTSTAGPARAARAANAIARERANVMAQLTDPSTRALVACRDRALSSPDMAARCDVLRRRIVNRSVATGKSLQQLVHSGCYGPVNRGELRRQSRGATERIATRSQVRSAPGAMKSAGALTKGN